MEYALFLGCLIPVRVPNMEAAARKVLPEFGVELRDMEGAGCCPDPIGLKSIDFKTWLALAARNLCIAEEMGLDMLVLCSGCASTLKKANSILKKNGGLRSEVNQVLSDVGKEYKGEIEIKHVMQVLYSDIGLKGISDAAEKKLRLKIAPHYGCHVTRPADVMEFGSPEAPKFLDQLLRSIGAEPVDYGEKYLCCGLNVRAIDHRVALDVIDVKLKNMVRAGAECVSFICPFCFIQLDIGQFELKREKKITYNLPVLYYLQLLGLAMEMRPEELGIRFHKVKADSLLEKL